MDLSNVSIAMKSSLTKKPSEMEKLEKCKRAHLKMLTSSGAKLKMKQGSTESAVQPFGDVEAKNIKMYETHVPGFCYLRNGECRKHTANATSSAKADPIQCSEKVKSILFTDDELDIYKTMCLHLLGTHVHTRAHIQRKDGRLCSYVKAQTTANTPQTLQPYSQRLGITSNKSASKYDKMLPRYILDVKLLCRGMSTCSLRTCDFENSGSDEETKKKRKHQVPIYINNEIRMIVQSVMEALEAVNSPKLQDLINLASSPEELRNMLKNEEFHYFMTELSNNPLVVKATSYDFVMTHPMFDKIPERGTLESVAQVLEIFDNLDLQKSICQIQKAIYQRHKELVDSNIIPRTMPGLQERTSIETSKISKSSVTSSVKTMNNAASSVVKKEKGESGLTLQKEIKESNPDDQEMTKKSTTTKSVTVSLENSGEENRECVRDTHADYEETSVLLENKGSFSQSRSGSFDSNKFSFENLSNPQRILLGLKIASLKCKPINMHQFEGKKKIDVSSILAPIIHSQGSDSDVKQYLPETQIASFLPERKEKKSSNNLSELCTGNLENLTRELLANLRLDISESENKKRVNQFMATISRF